MKVTPFTIGCLVILISLLLYFSCGSQSPPLLSNLDKRLLDTMFLWRGPAPTTDQVVIVDLDERSLQAFGQWPWPRDLIATLLDIIGTSGAAVVGLDMVFAESDRTSPARYLQQLQTRYPAAFIPENLQQLLNIESLDHDQTLGRTLAELPSVLGYVFQFHDDGLKQPDLSPFPAASIRLEPAQATFSELRIPVAYRPILNVPAVSQALSEGFFNVFPDTDGVVRKVPLLIAFDSLPYPSLALELARLKQNVDTVVINAAPADTGNRPLLGLGLGRHFIPTDETGQLTVNYRGPAYTFPYVSAADLLSNSDTDRLHDKVVLIGTSAAGLLDLRATPFSSVYPGVEVHATVIDNILAQDPMLHDMALEAGLTYVMIFVGGLLLTTLLARSGALTGGVGAVLLMVAAVTANYYFLFQQQIIVGLTYPLLVLIVLFMVVTLGNYFFEGRQKRFISKAFSQYVPPELVDEMAARPDDLAIGGETREMTVLFSDVRGFTTISEGMEATELSLLMNQLLTPMTRIIHQHRGTIDKYMGDAIMAFWGAPLHDADHARHALAAGMAMIADLPRLQQEFKVRGWPALQIGIGINSGPMNVGNMGSEFRMAYTVLGDAVNLGSRLEGLTKEYGVTIIVSEHTKELVPDMVYRELDRVRVKGKDRPVTLYEPLGMTGQLEPAVEAELEHYHQALYCYRERNFATARQLFIHLHQQQPEYPLYRLYLDRIEHLLIEPPPDTWDASFTHTSK